MAPLLKTPAAVRQRMPAGWEPHAATWLSWRQLDATSSPAALEPTRTAQLLHAPVFYRRMILEGGSIEVNGAGALLTTESCLLNPNRNPRLGRAEIEQRLRDYFGVREILWLAEGIDGDDTDGHIDDLARFVSEHTVVTVVE